MNLRTLVAFVLLAVCHSAHADTFTYTFSESDGAADFTFTGSTLFTTNATFVPVTCQFHGYACIDVPIRPYTPPTPGFVEFDTTALPFSASTYFIYDPAFFTVGTHTQNQGNFTITLTIVDNATGPPDGSPVPEPNGSALTGSAMLIAVSALYWRSRARAPA